MNERMNEYDVEFYCILEAPTARELAAKVDAMLKESWTLWGELVVVKNADPGLVPGLASRFVFFQAMVRD